MRLGHRIEKKICVVEILDNSFDSINEFMTYIAPVLSNDEIIGIILDMGGVEFINSSSIGGLLLLSSRVKRRNKEFAIAGLENSLSTTLRDVSKIDDVLLIFSSIEAGIEAFSQEKGDSNSFSSLMKNIGKL